MPETATETTPRRRPTQSFTAPDGVLFAPAAADAPEGSDLANETLPGRCVLVVAHEGEVTADRRVVDAGALDWRSPPLSLTVNHDAARIAGRLDAFGRFPSLAGLTVENFADKAGSSGDYVCALVAFDLGYDASGHLQNADAEGREAARMVEGGFLLGVSMEIGNEQISVECIAEDEDGFCDEYLMHLEAGTIGAVTLAPFQAIESARVQDVADADEEALAAAVDAALVAAAVSLPSWWRGPDPTAPAVPRITNVRPRAISAAGVADLEDTITLDPPAAWFEDPQLPEPTPLTFEPSGHVYGHIAIWGTCHIGRQDVCITPPRSASNYAYFRTGSIAVAEGGEVPVGVFTMGTGHAPLTASPSETVEHYDTASGAVQAAYLGAGEDDHGIWVAGMESPDVDRSRKRVLQAAAASGDWRRIGGALELVGLLAVNVPGYPIPRPGVMVAGGHQTALVAAGAIEALTASGCGCGGGSPSHGMDRAALARLGHLEAVVAACGLEDQAIANLTAALPH